MQVGFPAIGCAHPCKVMPATISMRHFVLTDSTQMKQKSQEWGNERKRKGGIGAPGKALVGLRGSRMISKQPPATYCILHTMCTLCKLIAAHRAMHNAQCTMHTAQYTSQTAHCAANSILQCCGFCHYTLQKHRTQFNMLQNTQMVGVPATVWCTQAISTIKSSCWKWQSVNCSAWNCTTQMHQRHSVARAAAGSLPLPQCSTKWVAPITITATKCWVHQHGQISIPITITIAPSIGSVLSSTKSAIIKHWSSNARRRF